MVTEAVGVGREAEGQAGRGQVAALDLSADMLLDAPAEDLTAGLINQPALDGMMRAEHVPEEQPMLLPPLPEGVLFKPPVLECSSSHNMLLARLCLVLVMNVMLWTACNFH